jgi:hypothetical protein
VTSELDLFRSICEKSDVEVWIHHGALCYRDPNGRLTAWEKRLLERGGLNVAHLAAQYPPNMGDEPFGVIPLSLQQQWKLSRADAAFYAAFGTRIRGPVDVAVLSEAIRLVIATHGALRTRICLVGRVASQQVGPEHVADVDIVTLRATSDIGAETEMNIYLEDFVQHWIEYPSSSFAARIVKVSAKECALFVLWDHLFEDYTSSMLVFGEIWRLYRDLISGCCRLPESAPQYADYAVWQRRAYRLWEESNSAHWQRKLKGGSPVKLPPDNDSTGGQAATYRQLTLDFNADTTSALSRLSQSERIPLSLVFLGFVGAAMAEWSGQHDFIIPFASSGRYSPSQCSIVGYLPHVIPVRVSLSRKTTVRELIRHALAEYLESSRHLDIGKAGSDIVPGLLDGPWLQWFQSNPAPGLVVAPAEQSITELTFEPVPVRLPKPRFTTTATCQLSQVFYYNPAGLIGCTTYRADLYAADTVDQFLRSLRRLALQAISDPGAPVLPTM